MSKQTIYDALIGAGMTKEGALGVMGNMMAESGLKSNIAQRGMTTLSDEMYTSMIDNGWQSFEDGIGYGLCQWTYFSRKRALLAFAKSKGVSVGDEAMQVEFCTRELTESYNNVMLVLQTSHDLYECTKTVCVRYEQPAVNNVEARYKFAKQLQKELCGGGSADMMQEAKAQSTAPEVSDACPIYPPDPSVMVIQMVMSYNGYWGKPDGQKTPEFFEALKTFTEDMAKC